MPALAAVILTIADQWSKAWITAHFGLYEAKAVSVNFFHIVHVRNTGVAFGLLSNLNPKWVNPLLIVATLLAIASLLAYIYFLPHRGPAPFGLGLILGGALGNLIDRARFGYVVDFLDFHWHRHHWPAFNVADIGITIGVFLLLLDLLFWAKEGESPSGPR
ncbi:MAG TPA: signal peptidase II [Candidatus Deferrimicrobiaceae bacterium]|nr:signal peptidase II [Candidatus Deferrimicrobiaceae bacterium]